MTTENIKDAYTLGITHEQKRLLPQMSMPLRFPMLSLKGKLWNHHHQPRKNGKSLPGLPWSPVLDQYHQDVNELGNLYWETSKAQNIQTITVMWPGPQRMYQKVQLPKNVPNHKMTELLVINSGKTRKVSVTSSPENTFFAPKRREPASKQNCNNIQVRSNPSLEWHNKGPDLQAESSEDWDPKYTV